MKTLLIGLVCSAGMLVAVDSSAQEPPKPILVNPAVMPAGYSQPVPSDCEGCGRNGPNGDKGYYGAKTGGKHGVIHRCIDKFERHGCGYGKTHHDFGCLSVRAHWVFVFGNCQQFFEEPCYKQPEHRWFQK